MYSYNDDFFFHRHPSPKKFRLDGSIAYCPLLLYHGWYLRTHVAVFLELTLLHLRIFVEVLSLKISR
jgi:hypothetical protein